MFEDTEIGQDLSLLNGISNVSSFEISDALACCKDQNFLVSSPYPVSGEWEMATEASSAEKLLAYYSSGRFTSCKPSENHSSVCTDAFQEPPFLENGFSKLISESLTQQLVPADSHGKIPESSDHLFDFPSNYNPLLSPSNIELGKWVHLDYEPTDTTSSINFQCEDNNMIGLHCNIETLQNSIESEYTFPENHLNSTLTISNPNEITNDPNSFSQYSNFEQPQVGLPEGLPFCHSSIFFVPREIRENFQPVLNSIKNPSQIARKRTKRSRDLAPRVCRARRYKVNEASDGRQLLPSHSNQLEMEAGLLAVSRKYTERDKNVEKFTINFDEKNLAASLSPTNKSLSSSGNFTKRRNSYTSEGTLQRLQMFLREKEQQKHFFNRDFDASNVQKSIQEVFAPFSNQTKIL